MSKKNPTGLKIIAIMKLLSAVLLASVGLGLIQLLKSNDVEDSVRRILFILNFDPKNWFINTLLIHFVDIDPSKLKKIGIGTVIYAVLYFIEGVGLLKAKRWAEYMTVIITASLLPIEIIEIVNKPGILKVTALGVNIVIVVYLIYLLGSRKK